MFPCVAEKESEKESCGMSNKSACSTIYHHTVQYNLQLHGDVVTPAIDDLTYGSYSG